MNFDLFSIEESQDCQYDYLNVIFNATSSTASPQRYLCLHSSLKNAAKLLLCCLHACHPLIVSCKQIKKPKNHMIGVSVKPFFIIYHVNWVFFRGIFNAWVLRFGSGICLNSRDLNREISLVASEWQGPGAQTGVFKGKGG